MKKNLLSLGALLLFLQFTYSQDWTSIIRDYDITKIKTITTPNGNSFKYFFGDKDILIGPIIGKFTDEDKIYIFDPHTKLTYVYNDSLVFQETLDYKLGENLSFNDPGVLLLSKSYLILGDNGDNSDYLLSYKLNQGFAGFYFFEKNLRSGIQNSNNKRIYFIGEYAFYFKSPGVVEWLERPLSETEIISGTYKQLIRSNIGKISSVFLNINGTNVEITVDGVLFKNGTPMLNIWQNLWNFSVQKEEKKGNFNNTRNYLFDLSNKFYWLGYNSILLTNDKLSEEGVLLLDEYTTDPILGLFKPYPNSIRSSFVYTKKYGILGLSVGFSTGGPAGLESSRSYYETNILQISPRWDKK